MNNQNQNINAAPESDPILSHDNVASLSQAHAGQDNANSNVNSKSRKFTNFRVTLCKIGKEIFSYFNITDDLVPQSVAEAEIRAGVSFKGQQLLILIFAILVASLGLNTNSIPVIIGAMLISPLMGPIIGMGLALGIRDYQLLRRGLKNIVAAILGSLAASALYFLISPQYGNESQLLARTSPSIYDVLIALFGGAAGIVSIVCKNKGQVMPGVAIATSLMPPLCTAGYGLATWQLHFLLGALYLFFTNMIFILFATWITVKILRYHSIEFADQKRSKRVTTIVYSIVFATVCISILLTIQMIGKTIFLNNAAEFVDKEMVFPNTQVLNHKEYIKGRKRYIDVTLIGAALPKDSLQLAMMQKLDSVGLGGTILNIKQGFTLDADAKPVGGNLDHVYDLVQMEIESRDNAIDSLKQVIANQDQLRSMSRVLSPEIKVLFPRVQDVALSRIVVSSVAEPNAADTLNMAFVNAPSGLSIAERRRMKEYLEVRLNEPNIHLAVNPTGFPW